MRNRETGFRVRLVFFFHSSTSVSFSFHKSKKKINNTKPWLFVVHHTADTFCVSLSRCSAPPFLLCSFLAFSHHQVTTGEMRDFFLSFPFLFFPTHTFGGEKNKKRHPKKKGQTHESCDFSPPYNFLPKFFLLTKTKKLILARRHASSNRK